MSNLARKAAQPQSNVIVFPSHRITPKPLSNLDLNDIVAPNGGNVGYIEDASGVLMITTPEGTWWLIKQEAA